MTKKNSDKAAETKPAAEAKPAAEGKAAPEAKKASAPWAKLGPNSRGASVVDPDTNVRYSTTPVPMAGIPKEGSWFDCQMKAGLLIIIQGPAE